MRREEVSEHEFADGQVELFFTSSTGVRMAFSGHAKALLKTLDVHDEVIDPNDSMIYTGISRTEKMTIILEMQPDGEKFGEIRQL